MNYIIALMFLLTAQLHKGVSWNSEGTEFITAFMQNYIPSSSYRVQLSISVTALNPSTSVYVIIYNTSFEVSLTLEEWETADIPLPASIQLIDTTVSSTSTVIVRSNKPITVLSINYEQYTADTSTIFPVNALGTEYFVFAPRGAWNSFMSQFVIINYNQTNEILVTVAGSINYNGSNYSPGDNLTIVLSAFETIQLQSSSILTGTRIQSQYPIAVLSGKNCATYNSACDIVFEQLIPVNDWGKTFLVSSIAVQNYADIVTVIASQRTDVQYTTGGISSNMTLQEGQYSEIRLLSNSSLFISATQWIMVMYTFTGGYANNYPSDPFIMNVIPFESLSSSYIITTEIHVNNSVRVIAKMSNLLEIFSDNHVVSYMPAWNFINGTDYTWTDIVLGSVNQSFVLQHCSPFAAYIYGIEQSVGIGTIAPAINRTLSCEIADVTIRSMTNGSIFVKWIKDNCTDSYVLTLTKSDDPAFTEEKVINGNSAVFTAHYVSSDYTLTVQAVTGDRQCLPLVKQFTHFGFSWSSAGTEFITAFVQNNDSSNLDNAFHLEITAVSPATSIHVIIYNTSFEVALTLGDRETSSVNIPASAKLQGTELSSTSTVIVRSDKPITVLSIDYKPATGDSANIFPVDALGTKYYVFAPIQNDGVSEFAVINYNQTNEIQITVTGSLLYNGLYYNSGDNITLVLSSFEAIQFQSSTVLTGTRIQSEYPIAVLSGNSCDRYNSDCDLMFEQLLPENEWGRKFLVVSIAPQGYTDIVSVVASQRTEITYSIGSWNYSAELLQGQNTEIHLSSSSSLYLTATKPVMVMYTFTGGDYNNYTADPFIMNILPFESFSSSYIINTQSNFNNYIQLIAKSSVISEIMNSNGILSSTSIQGNVTMTDYAWAMIELGQGSQTFIIKHCSAFVAYIYGTVSYGGIGTTALAMNEFQQCQTSNMTITYLMDDSALVSWPKSDCVDSYLLQLTTPDNPTALQEKMTYENYSVFTGLQACSVYNVTMWAVFEGEKCLPEMKQLTITGLQKCKSFNVTVTTMADGYAQVTWPRVGCVDSYFLQLSEPGSSIALQQQMTHGNSVVFFGLRLCSSYNLTIQTMFQGESCPPLQDEFLYFGIKPCEISNVTMQSKTDGSILVKWTESGCANSYIVQLSTSESYDVIEEKMVYGNSTLFSGPYAPSVYNITIVSVIPDKQCLPHVETFRHSGMQWNSAGTEFITAYVRNYIYGYANFYLKVTALSPSTSVSIIVFNTTFKADFTLEERETSTTQIPSSAELPVGVISSNTAVIVRSNKPITVFSINYEPTTADSSEVLPVERLGTEYYVFSPVQSYGEPEFAIVNYNQTNEILILLTGPVTYNGSDYQTGSNISVVLSAFETLQLQSSVSLTGTRIQSKYPVAVLSGNSCDRYNGACDLEYEQLIPSNDWGRMFLVASIAVPNNADIVTIIASQRTEITYTGWWNNTITLQNGQFVSVSLPSSSSLVINATQRVMVMYTFTGGFYNGYTADTFIMSIIPMESFSSSYVINAEINLNNYIHVIAKTSMILEIMEDFNNDSFTQMRNFVTMADYTWAIFDLHLVNGSIIIKHCSPFAAYTYGTGSWVGFGATALAITRTPQCVDFSMTVTPQEYGFIQANWTNDACADSYLLQLSTADGFYVLQEKSVTGTSTIFTGLTIGSVYNLSIWAVIADETCLPMSKQFKYCGIYRCDNLDLGVTSLANGSIQANWTKFPCVNTYLVQLQRADNPSVLEQKIVNGSLIVFPGPYHYSVYNVTLWTMYSDEQCPPLAKQVTHFGKKVIVIARAEVNIIGRAPVDENVITDALGNKLYDLLPPKLQPFVKIRVQPV